MDIWLERFVLAVLAAAFLSLVVLNLMKLDMTQRITLGIAIAALSYFVGHTISLVRSKTVATLNEVPERLQEKSSQEKSPSVDSSGQESRASEDLRGATLEVTDEAHRPLPGANVLVVGADGTHSQLVTTDEKGVVEIKYGASRLATLYCAHPHFHNYRRSGFDTSQSALVQMSRSSEGGSLIIPDGIGYVPGLEGRLNPILDTEGRTYLYATNIAIQSGQAQPVTFVVGQPLTVRDNRGATFRLTITDIVGSSSLVEYSKIATSSGSGPS